MFSDHFKLSLKSIAVIIAILLGCFFWIKHKIHDVIVPPQIALLAADKELISYNENRHTISVTTAKGTTTQYSRNPKVEIRKDGTVKVDADAYGWEVRPFIGIGYSDTARAYAGCQLFYFHQFDAALSVGIASAHPALQPMLSVGWNFWSNTSLNVGINPLTIAGINKPEPALFLSVRL